MSKWRYSNTPITELRSFTEYRIRDYGGAVTPPPLSGYLLMEDGFYILLEDGGRIEFEATVAPTYLLMENGIDFLLLEDGSKIVLES